MRFFDFSSWQAVLASLIGIALFALIGVGIRILMMLTIQQRQQRMNRQINERLKTLMAAYRVLGGSFTGTLEVDPAHLRALRRSAPDDGILLPADPGADPGAGADPAVDIGAEAVSGAPAAGAAAVPPGAVPARPGPSAEILERRRRIRDAVEAALSDILLLGTEDHVRMAEAMARDLAEGRAVRTGDLVVSLRDYIRKALGLEPIPEGLTIPPQGPTRPQSGSSGKGGRDGGEGRGGGGGGGAGGGMGGMGMGMGLGAGRREDDRT
jgi:uncharacterized membrane protein YgcG